MAAVSTFIALDFDRTQQLQPRAGRFVKPAEVAQNFPAHH
jgi:hypothetical protein